MTADWLNERPEPVLTETMATEAAIARREAADEPHPLTCRCHECADYDFLLDPLRDFDTDEERW